MKGLVTHGSMKSTRSIQCIILKEYTLSYVEDINIVLYTVAAQYITMFNYYHYVKCDMNYGEQRLDY